jgi:hypothetical protein
MIARCYLMGAFGTLAALSGCSPSPKDILRSETTSPDGTLLVRVDVDTRGGAPVADVTEAYIVAPNSKAGESGKLIFKGSAMSQFAVVWDSPRSVKLSYTYGYVDRCESLAIMGQGKAVKVIGCKDAR